MDDQRYSLTEHLNELRRRLGRGLLAVLVCAGGSLTLSDDIFKLMSEPLSQALPPGSKFVVVSPMEYVLTSLQIALTFGLVLASPYVLYQLWLFVAPGLYAGEQKLVRVLILATTFCFGAGAAFCYFVVFPFMIRFLLQMTPPEIVGMYSVDLYFGFFLKFIIGFGLAFELPVAIIALCWMGILDPAALARGRKYAIVLAFVAGGILTPTTDPYTQSMLAVPLILLFEAGIWGARLVGKRDKDERAEAKEKKAADAAAVPANTGT